MAKGVIGAVALLVLVAGCNPTPTDDDGKVTPAADGGTTALLASDLLVRHDREDYEFRATLPPEMALDPALARRVLAETTARQEKFRTSAEAGKADAAKGDYPYRRYSRSESWTTQAESEQLLVFTMLGWEFTGGAHGNSGTVGLIQDRKTGKEIAIGDLFTNSEQALAKLVPGWCEQLNEERKRRRGDVQATGFEDCPKLNEVTIVPYGTPSLTALKVIADPYVAGSFAEGSYEILLDPSPVLDLMRPEYRAAFEF